MLCCKLCVVMQATKSFDHPTTLQLITHDVLFETILDALVIRFMSRRFTGHIPIPTLGSAERLSQDYALIHAGVQQTGQSVDARNHHPPQLQQTATCC